LNMAHSHLPPAEKTGRDPLSRMRVYQLARQLLADSWSDAERLREHLVTEKVSGQLYAAVGSVVANIAEGYSRSSGRDRSRIFEYALGSVRESMTWYRSAEPVLGAEVVSARLDTLEEIRRLLLAIIPRERNRLIRPAKP
jgi:four helix bundle protein